MTPMTRLTKRTEIARSAILCRLSQGKATTRELAEACGEAMTVTSKHLGAMEQHGEVRSEWRLAHYGNTSGRRRFLVWALAPIAQADAMSDAVAA